MWQRETVESYGIFTIPATTDQECNLPHEPHPGHATRGRDKTQDKGFQ